MRNLEGNFRQAVPGVRLVGSGAAQSQGTGAVRPDLLQEGTSKQVAASLLGHADTAFLERTYCHPQDVAKQQAARLMQDLLNNQNPCYVAFMKNKNRKAKKAG